jgi:hypoxanthine phosphoribosyltransferase
LAGREVLLLGILNGGRKITQELAGMLRVPHVVDYVRASSYGDEQHSAGRVEVTLCPRERIAGREVLLVDDIADTGHTLAAVTERVMREGPTRLRTFILANKPLRRKVLAPLDYVGFTVPNRFVVGYGLSFRDRFHDLPFLGYVAEP